MQAQRGGTAAGGSNNGREPPLVVALNCLEDVGLEQDGLSGVALVEHVGLNRLGDGRIESASAVLLHSLAFLPRAAQRRLQPWQLILCLGSSDRAVDSALAADLGLHLVHVDTSRAEEVADTIMALILGLLRRTHALVRHGFSSSSWLGSIQPLCRGMRRCRGLVLGIVGRSASACCLATRSLAFKISVLYFDLQEEEIHTFRVWAMAFTFLRDLRNWLETNMQAIYALNKEDKGKPFRPSLCFPPAARRMDTLNDLLATSDLISLHSALSNETIQIINADCLQHVKPGAYIVNTGSSQLIDDCALKQLLIDGTIAGCALDGAEGPQWMEAWVREMTNVLILPRSADYSEEVWLEIREKAISVLQSFFLDGVVPKDAVFDEDEEAESTVADEHSEKTTRETSVLDCGSEQIASENKAHSGSVQKQEYEMEDSHAECQDSALSQVAITRSDGTHGRSSKKGKKRPARRKSQQKQGESYAMERDYNFTMQREDDTAISGREQAPSSSSHFASPDESRSRNAGTTELAMDATPDKHAVVPTDLRQSNQLLKDDYVIALHARDRPGFHVSRQRVPGGGWFLDTMSNVTKRDPAAQFVVALRGKDTIGLRSFAAGGKLLQINRKMEFVFASYSFDVWESWTLEGSSLDDCRLINCRNSSATLDVRIEILAAVGEEDGVVRWLN